MNEPIIQEEWRPVAGHEGLYEVSDLGRVRSLDRVLVCASRWGGFIKKRFIGKVLCLKRANEYGHLSVGLCRSGESKYRTVHRIALEAFVGPCPHGMECRHLDGDPTNNHISNLRWGTLAENSADALRHGTHITGSKHKNAKLTESDVIEIRSRHKSGGVSQRALASEYGICPAQIHRIINRQQWNHVEREDTK